MCEQCVKAKADLFPDATVGQFMSILWGHTCFPFGTALQVREHLEEYVRDLKTLADYGYGAVD